MRLEPEAQLADFPEDIFCDSRAGALGGAMPFLAWVSVLAGVVLHSDFNEPLKLTAAGFCQSGGLLDTNHGRMIGGRSLAAIR